MQSCKRLNILHMACTKRLERPGIVCSEMSKFYYVRSVVNSTLIYYLEFVRKIALLVVHLKVLDVRTYI